MKTYLLAFWKWLSHNFGLKLLALFSAFVIWIAVVNSQDPIDSVTFYNVPVKVMNEEALIRKDKIPEVVYGSTVTVTVQARKSICDALTSDSIVATADFEKIYVTDTVPIEISVSGYDESDVEIIRGQNSYMKLSLEDYATKEFKVRINTVGDPANGFVVGTNSSSPNVITIRGSKLQISRIQAVVATVNVEGASQGTEVVVKPVVYDMNDEEMSNENLELSANTVSVSTVLYRTKEIGLEAVTLGEPAKGYEVKSVSSQPSSITVAGTSEDLAKLGNSLKAYVDVSGRSADAESNIDIGSLIDSKLGSIMIVDEDTTLAVTAYIDLQGTTDVIIAPGNIVLENVNTGLEAKVIGTSDRIMTIRGKKETLRTIDVSLLNPHVDIMGIYQPGIYELPLKVNGYDGMEILTDITVKVEVMPPSTVPTENNAEER